MLSYGGRKIMLKRVLEFHSVRNTGLDDSSVPAGSHCLCFSETVQFYYFYTHHINVISNMTLLLRRHFISHTEFTLWRQIGDMDSFLGCLKIRWSQLRCREAWWQCTRSIFPLWKKLQFPEIRKQATMMEKQMWGRISRVAEVKQFHSSNTQLLL